jgi:hypothetical protein
MLPPHVILTGEVPPPPPPPPPMLQSWSRMSHTPGVLQEQMPPRPSLLLHPIRSTPATKVCGTHLPLTHDVQMEPSPQSALVVHSCGAASTKPAWVWAGCVPISG